MVPTCKPKRPKKKIYLAPMEGLADHYLRAILTSQGGFDLAVSEFIRVVDHALPDSVFYRQVPELHHGAKTASGTPVRIQLLGNHPEAMAANALTAIRLGSHGVDINFGCPSKTVNKSKGGAILLKEPETLFAVVHAIRKAVPETETVSAKMRLGYDDDGLFNECAHAIAEGGANELTIHARTKVQGYTPPAFWHLTAGIQEALNIPIIINGEIWTPQDAEQALNESGASHLMIGRGAVRDPFLAKRIASHDATETHWDALIPLLVAFWESIVTTMSERFCVGRLKQWLNHLRVHHAEAETFFGEIRKTNDIATIDEKLRKLACN